MSAEDVGLATVMAQVARTLGASSDREETLASITRCACDTIPGADFASVSVRYEDGHLETFAPTSDIITRADALQYTLREGPCYEAATHERTVSADDLSDDPRWPRYGPAVVEMGLRSQLALELYDGPRSTGALNLYSRSLGVLTGQQDLAGLFAVHAAVAMGHVRTVSGLLGALETRRVIGAAIGITMERYRIDEDEAFSFLIRVSQTSNIKLREIAVQIVNRRDQVPGTLKP
jgi:GAF domain-containing protein